ncbi:hypothetical protein ASH04_23680 [Rhodococcus sp. Leaf233]|nr:hypothetical protein ASH04_23680 [Rhodococcus sp. Leaf233]
MILRGVHHVVSAADPRERCRTSVQVHGQVIRNVGVIVVVDVVTVSGLGHLVEVVGCAEAGPQASVSA